MVMGGVSCSKGCEFEFLQGILDGHFFTYILVVKICNVCLKRLKSIKKRPGLAHFIQILTLKQYLASSARKKRFYFIQSAP